MHTNVSEVTKIKRRVYISLARLAMKDQLVEKIETIPETLCTSDTPRYRCCEYKEQAILSERIKLAMGFDPDLHKHTPLSKLAAEVENVEDDEKVIRVLSIACDHCPIDKFIVTDACRNCVAHSCQNVCPKNAIVIIQNKAFIDQGKCIECGRCKDVCSFGAIHQNSRPCERACAVKAIRADFTRQASIDYDKCVGCGSCVISCPFGAIGDTTQIVQVVKMLKNSEERVKAILAPSFLGQFGAKVGPEKIKAALQQIGFTDVYEAALGADMVALNEAHELVERLEENQPFMTSSCCPSFLSLVEQHFPEFADYPSLTVSPMIALARSLKRENPEEKVIFIGPCITKKLEAKGEESLDAVLTFEELGCILVSMGINLTEYNSKVELNDASRHGRNFAYAGGLKSVIGEVLKLEGKEDMFKPIQVDGLSNCVDLLKQISNGKLDCNFIEGMGCHGGCVGGPGNMMNMKVTTKLVQNFANKSEWKLATENERAEEMKKDLAEKIER